MAIAAMSPVAAAETPDRNQAWDALIAEAKEHGAEETKLDRSTSYVFQRPDGSYLTFTRLPTTDKGRSVCLIAKELTATACVDWDTGKVKLGKRRDAATPWKFFAFDSLEALEAARPSLFDQAMANVNIFLSFMSECTHFSFGQVVPNKQCSLFLPHKGALGD
jgi:hypothetical protein